MAGTDNCNKPSAEDGRLLYQGIVDSNRDLKARQWSVTYYAILLLAAIFGLYNAIHVWPELQHHEFWRWLLAFVALIFGLFGAAIIWRIQNSLIKNGEILKNLEAITYHLKSFGNIKNIGNAIRAFVTTFIFGERWR